MLLMGKKKDTSAEKLRQKRVKRLLKLAQSGGTPRSCKPKCCKKYQKCERKRCKKCPCFDLLKKLGYPPDIQKVA